MDLHNLKVNRRRIITEYSEELNPIDARHIRYEIDWLLSRSDDNNWCTFEDAYMDRIAEKQYLDVTTEDERKALATLEYEKDENLSPKWKNADGSLVDFCGIK